MPAGSGAKRTGRASVDQQERPKRAGERILLLSDCGIIRSGIGWGLVHVAFTLPDLLHGWLRGCFSWSGLLVWSGGPETESRFVIG